MFEMEHRKHSKENVSPSTSSASARNTVQVENQSYHGQDLIGDSNATIHSSVMHVRYEEEDDYYLKFNSIAGWQTLLLLQFLPQMYIVLIVYLYLWYGTAIFMVAFSFGCPSDEIPQGMGNTFLGILYAGDIGYFVDWISMVIFKNVKWPDLNIKYKTRHGFVLFIELLSLIPYEPIYGVLVKPNMRTYHCLRMRYTLRLIRLYVYFKQSMGYVGVYGVFLYLLIYFGILILVVITASGIYYVYYCDGRCTFADKDVLSKVIYITFESISYCGIKIPLPENWHPIMDNPIAALFTFCITQLFASVFTCDILQRMWPQFSWKMMYRRCNKRIDTDWKNKLEWKCYYINFQRLIDEHCQISLTKQTISLVAAEMKLLPRILYKDFALDISWVALKHTHLFRNEDVFFLRAVAEKMEHKFLCPGEVVFKKNVKKSALVYIISGNIDVLSEEDGETPIITFTSGTSLGESCLAFGYRSISTVISRDVSDVAILEHKQLIQLAKLYPEKIKKIMMKIMKRYRKARSFRHIAKYQYRRSGDAHEKVGVLSLKWLKLTLRNLLYDNSKGIQSSYNSDISNEVEEQVFCTRYLDLLVQSEYTGIITNSTFIRTKFPIIFRPGSLLLKIWECSILVHSLVLAISFPVSCIYYSEIPLTYKIFHSYITIVWGLDIYVQSSTAVYTKFVQCTTVVDIFMYRLASLSFNVDVLSTLPLEAVFMIMNGRFTQTDAIISFCNRLLKLYRLETFFVNVQTSAKGIACVTFLKYFLYFFLMCYYIATFFCILSDLDLNRDAYEKFISQFSTGTTFERIYYNYILAVAFAEDLCLFQFPFSLDVGTSVMLMIIMVCYEMFTFFSLAHTTVIEALKRIDEHDTDNFMRSVEVTIEVYGLEKSLEDRIMNYIDLHKMAMGNSFLFEADLFKQLPRDLYVIAKGIYPGLFMKNLTFFVHLDDRIVQAIAATCSVNLVLSDETFKSHDEICPDILILMEGFCNVRYTTGEKRIVGPGEMFCVLEVAFELKSLVHITSITNCKIITLQYNAFKQILFRYSEDYQHLEETVKYFPYWEELEKLAEVQPLTPFTRNVYESKRKENLKYFGYHCRRRDIMFYELRSGFPRWARFMQYLLLHITFYSGGNFVFYWELSHCVCVILYLFTVYLSLVIGPADYRWLTAKAAFEFIGFVDIYLRHHFSYYDRNNLEITHPYKTCMYYWKHAFALDLLAWLPFELIFYGRSIDYMTFWRLNRLVQLYRVFGFLSYIISTKTKLRGCWRMLTYTPLVVLLLNIISYCVLKIFCTRVDRSYECSPGTWIATFNTTSTYETYSYNLMFVTILITGSNNYLITIHTPIEMHIYLVLACVKFMIHIVFSAKIVAANLAINRDLSAYQEAMQNLITFLNYLKIDKALKRETIKHFEYIWEKTRGKQICNTFSVFKSYFKADLLYNIYGKALEHSTIFLQPNENFFRALLMETEHELYLKRGTIYDVNDVSGDLFILIKGKVEIVGADLNRLETLLVGSVFGNLDKVQRGRRTLSAVTSGHVEVLKVNSMVFYKHLSRFPKMLKHFKKLTRFHVDFIQEESIAERNKELMTYRIPSEVLTILYGKQVKKSCRTKIFKRNLLIRIWEVYVLNIMYLLSYMLEMLNMSTNTHFTIYFLLYVFDIMYILKIYLRLHTGFEDEYGRTIRLRHMIFKRYKNQRFGLFFDLATLVPLELLSLSFISTNYFETVFKICRINRLPRILLTFFYCKNITQKLNVNVVFVRFRYLFLWVFLVQYNFAFLLKLTDPFKDTDATNAVAEFMRFLVVVIDASRHVSSDVLHFDQNWFKFSILNTILIGTTIISFVFMAECCAIILLLTYTSALYKNFVMCMNKLVESENVSTPLLERIGNYMDLLWTHHKGIQFPQLLREAPRYLKEGVLYSMFGNHLIKHPVLMYCHKDLTRQICLYMETLVFFPGDNVAYMGDIDNCMYFVQEGEVQALIEDAMYSEVAEFVLKEGDTFGLHQGLFPRRGHLYTYKCTMYTILVVLCRDDWIHLLDFFPASKRKIFEVSKAGYVDRI